MPRNGSGTMVLPHDWELDRDNGVKIRADRAMEQDNDIATEITNSIAKDGQTSPTANLPMATLKHTNVGAASNPTDYLRADQAQTNGLTYFVASGTNDYAITPLPTVAALSAGLGFWVLFTNGNTGASTLAVGGLAQTALTKNGSAALASGDIPAGMIAFCQYDGTQFQIQRTVASISQLAGLGQGSWEIPVPASAMWVPTTNGADAFISEIAATQPTVFGLAFDPSTKQYAQFAIRWPKSLGTATFTFTPIWYHPATTVNFGVVFSLAGLALANDDALATAFGTAQKSTDTGGTTNDLYIGPVSAAITAGNSPATSDFYYFQIAREVSDGGDTLAVDANLLGITLTVTVGAVNDG